LHHTGYATGFFNNVLPTPTAIPTITAITIINYYTLMLYRLYCAYNVGMHAYSRVVELHMPILYTVTISAPAEFLIELIITIGVQLTPDPINRHTRG